mgnify:CR=1 FL=1
MPIAEGQHPQHIAGDRFDPDCLHCEMERRALIRALSMNVEIERQER